MRRQLEMQHCVELDGPEGEIFFFPLPTLCTFIIAVDGKMCYGFPHVLSRVMKGEDKSRPISDRTE